MTKREVKRALGRPGAKTNTKRFLSGYRSVVVMGGGSMPNEEHWMYYDYPAGQNTMITFQHGRVVKVMSRPPG